MKKKQAGTNGSKKVMNILKSNKDLRDTEKILTKKYTKDLIKGTIKELIKEFVEEMRTFKRHYFNVCIQESAFKMCRETVKDDEIMIICDFSENDTCKMSEEIQSANIWSQQKTVYFTYWCYLHRSI